MGLENEPHGSLWLAKCQSGDMRLESEPCGRPQEAIGDGQLETGQINGLTPTKHQEMCKNNGDVIHYSFPKLGETVDATKYKTPRNSWQIITKTVNMTQHGAILVHDNNNSNYSFFTHLDDFVAEKILNDGTTVKNDLKEFITSRNPDFYKNDINAFASR